MCMSLILDMCSKANICGLENIAREVREEGLESRACHARMQTRTVQLSV